jgi:antibiotic biosynthesis monooxygenase (ABM) superfamily enzyme
MNPSTAEPTGPVLEVRGASAAAIIVQRVPTEKAERFLELQRGIVEAARGFSGYQKVDVYRPEIGSAEWVVVIHFDNQEALQCWLNAPVRAEWIARFRDEIGESRLHQVPAGFGAWFAGNVGREGDKPPSWKIALSVLLTLYPTVMLLAILVGSYLAPLGLAVSMLISNILSIAILEWVVTPPVNRLLATWLGANGTDTRRATFVGLVLILTSITVMTALFKLVTG